MLDSPAFEALWIKETLHGVLCGRDGYVAAVRTPPWNRGNCRAGHHINERSATRGHLLTAAKTGCPIGRDTPACPRHRYGNHQRNTHRHVSQAGLYQMDWRCDNDTGASN
jgi:hypothetical protein